MLFSKTDHLILNEYVARNLSEAYDLVLHRAERCNLFAN
jgi:hypothetical protein